MQVRLIVEESRGKTFDAYNSLPIGSIVVPFWDYLIGFKIMKLKKELLWSLWV